MTDSNPFNNNFFRLCFVRTCESESFNIVNYLALNQDNELQSHSIPVCVDHSDEVEIFIDYNDSIKHIETINRLILTHQ